MKSRRILLVLVVCLAGLVLAHPWVLPALASGLIRDDPVGRADFVVLVGGDGRYEWVARQTAAGNVAEVLLIQSPPKRLYSFGVLPYPHQRARSELLGRGVEAEDLVVIGPPAWDLWEVADRLESWLADHPGATVACVVDRLGSGSVDAVFRQVLSPDAFERVTIHSLRDRRYDESDWWKSRRGLKSFYGAASGFLTVRFAGRPEYRFVDEWDADAFERELREASGEKRVGEG